MFYLLHPSFLHYNRFVDTGEMPETFPYRTKALFAFEEIDGVDVCFFGMHVQEYGSECLFPNTRSVHQIIKCSRGSEVMHFLPLREYCVKFNVSSLFF